MLILGLDPGSRYTGWGLVAQEGSRHTYVASGTLRLNERSPLPERLVRLADGLEALLAEHRPAACALEQIYTSRNARSALVLGHARGVILCAVGRAGVPLHEYQASQVKQAVVGAGAAPKEQMQRMVAMLLGCRHALGEDEADALALALTHAAVARFPVNL